MESTEDIPVCGAEDYINAWQGKKLCIDMFRAGKRPRGDLYAEFDKPLLTYEEHARTHWPEHVDDMLADIDAGAKRRLDALVADFNSKNRLERIAFFDTYFNMCKTLVGRKV